MKKIFETVISIPLHLIRYVGRVYAEVVKAFGGRSHFMNLIGIALVGVGFFSHGESAGFPIFAGVVAGVCGLQSYRSVQSDKVPEKTPDDFNGGDPKP